MGHNRGDLFEQIIISSNTLYQNKMIAQIQKIPTPMKAKRNYYSGEAEGCYFSEKSTVDFMGVYNGAAISFDAKATEDVSRFPLSNWKPHQVEFMQRWHKLGGITFSLLWLIEVDKYYVLPHPVLFKYWEGYMSNKGKKGFGSIPFDVIENNCIEVKTGRGAAIDYLKFLG